MRDRLAVVGMGIAVLAGAGSVVLWYPAMIGPSFQQTWTMLAVMFAVPMLSILGLVFSLPGVARPAGKVGAVGGIVLLVGYTAWCFTHCGGWGR